MAAPRPSRPSRQLPRPRVCGALRFSSSLYQAWKGISPGVGDLFCSLGPRDLRRGARAERWLFRISVPGGTAQARLSPPLSLPSSRGPLGHSPNLPPPHFPESTPFAETTTPLPQLPWRCWLPLFNLDTNPSLFPSETTHPATPCPPHPGVTGESYYRSCDGCMRERRPSEAPRGLLFPEQGGRKVLIQGKALSAQ